MIQGQPRIHEAPNQTKQNKHKQSEPLRLCLSLPWLLGSQDPGLDKLECHFLVASPDLGDGLQVTAVVGTSYCLAFALVSQPACLSHSCLLCGAPGPICPRTSSLISLQVSGVPVGRPISGGLTQRRRRGLPGAGPAGTEESLILKLLLPDAPFTAWVHHRSQDTAVVCAEAMVRVTSPL